MTSPAEFVSLNIFIAKILASDSSDILVGRN